MPLSNEVVYDSAYEGNYVELVMACLQIIQVNGFFPLAKLWSNSGIDKGLAKLADQTPEADGSKPPA